MDAFNDIMEDVVSKVRLEYDPIVTVDEVTTGGKLPYWFCGYERELFEVLSEKTKHSQYKYEKYPLIALIKPYSDIESDVKTEVKGVTIYIITRTDLSIRTKGRIVLNYEPVLRPLKSLLRKYIKRSNYLSSEDYYEMESIEFPYWGNDARGANLGNDALDAIVIKNLNLKILKCK